MSGVTDWGDSLVSLDMGTLALKNSYVPADFVPYGYPNYILHDYANSALNKADFDLASAGPVTTAQNTVIQAGKDGLMRGFDTNLTRLDGPFHATFPVAGSNGRFPRLDVDAAGASDAWPRFYGGPAYWADSLGNGAVYVWGARDYPRLYGYTSFLGYGLFDGIHWVSKTEATGVKVKYCDDVACQSHCVDGANYSPPLTVPTFPPAHDDDVYEVADNLPGKMLAPPGVPGGALALSGTFGNGILWASINNPLHSPGDAEGHYQYGALYAFDAQNMNLLWTNDIFSNDIYGFAKYDPPTVTNGHVYLPALQLPGGTLPPNMPPTGPALDSAIYVYGL